ncbi:DNA repair protein RecO [Chitinophagaceae bacterium 26-R-25]|nr:DNA repair protein RecO [Chitinophagaceae bacterium 26-R-25]
MITFKTKGLVLKTVKYGETSVIVTVFTELFGTQTYLQNGVRTVNKKGQGKANLFQPGAILDLIVYHNELKNIQRIKEYKWGFLYQRIFFDVYKNAVALFIVELLQKCLKLPEANAELYYFIEDAMIHLDEGDDAVVANYPLFFALNLTNFFGFKIFDDYETGNNILNLQEGVFQKEYPQHQFFIEGDLSYTVSQLLKVQQPSELSQIKLNRQSRQSLMHSLELFYALHVPEFGHMRTLAVLQEVLS